MFIPNRAEFLCVINRNAYSNIYKLNTIYTLHILTSHLVLYGFLCFCNIPKDFFTFENVKNEREYFHSKVQTQHITSFFTRICSIKRFTLYMIHNFVENRIQFELISLLYLHIYYGYQSYSSGYSTECKYRINFGDENVVYLPGAYAAFGRLGVLLKLIFRIVYEKQKKF